LFILAIAGSALALPGSATFNYTNDFGSWTETELGEATEFAFNDNPIPLDCSVLWDYQVGSGAIPRFAVRGFNDDYV